MMEFTLDTDIKSTRPKILIHGIEALVDTGAQIPMCMFSENVVKIIFNAKPIWTGEIGGIGGKCAGRVFTFDELKVGKLRFPDIPIARSPTNAPSGTIRSFRSPAARVRS